LAGVGGAAGAGVAVTAAVGLEVPPEFRASTAKVYGCPSVRPDATHDVAPVEATAMPLTNTSYDVAPGVAFHVRATCVDEAVAASPVGVVGGFGRGVTVMLFDRGDVPPVFRALTVTFTATSLVSPVTRAVGAVVVADNCPLTKTL
jgi:hypothetical protein